MLVNLPTNMNGNTTDGAPAAVHFAPFNDPGNSVIQIAQIRQARFLAKVHLRMES